MCSRIIRVVLGYCWILFVCVLWMLLWMYVYVWVYVGNEWYCWWCCDDCDGDGVWWMVCWWLLWVKRIKMRIWTKSLIVLLLLMVSGVDWKNVNKSVSDCVWWWRLESCVLRLDWRIRLCFWARSCVSDAGFAWRSVCLKCWWLLICWRIWSERWCIDMGWICLSCIGCWCCVWDRCSGWWV